MEDGSRHPSDHLAASFTRVSLLAWVVAIEEYKDPTLNVGVRIGRHAFQMANLILESAPAAQVLLSHSLPIAEYEQELRILQSRGVRFTGASRNDIEKCLDELRGMEHSLSTG
jgi:hypothetical protein